MRTAVAILLLVAPALAHWSVFENRRVTDPNGRYYVVLRQPEWTARVRYTLARIGGDAPPVERAEYGSPEVFPEWSIERGVREGDDILSVGGLDVPPHSVVVSATGLGFLAVGDDRDSGVPRPLTLVPAAGKPIRALELADLFTQREINGFDLCSSGVGLLRGAWIDDGARRVVAVAYDGKFRTVGWDDGKVANGSDADIVRALDLPYDDARRLALELVAERRVAGAKVGAKRIFSDATEPTRIRLREALALAALGDRSGVEFVVARADEGYGYAIRHLVDALGEKAIPRLMAHIARADGHRTDGGILGAAAGLARLGTAAVPALTKLVVSKKNPVAAEVLVEIGDRRSVLPLLEAGFVEEAVAVSDDEIAPELTDLLRRGSPHLRELARFFSRVRYPPVVPHLKAALQEAGVAKETFTKKLLTRALKFQTADKKK